MGTRRCGGYEDNTHQWRGLLRIPPSPGVTPGCTFAFRIWFVSSSQPYYLLAVQRVGRDKAGQGPSWTCTVILQGPQEGRPEERLTWTGVVPDIESDSDALRIGSDRPDLSACVGKCMVIPKVQMAFFNESSSDEAHKLAFTVSWVFSKSNAEAAAAPRMQGMVRYSVCP